MTPKIYIRCGHHKDIIDYIDILADNFVDEITITNIITDIAFLKGRTIFILSSTDYPTFALETSYDSYRDILRIRESTVKNEHLVETFISFTQEDIDRIHQMKWYYGEGIYNFFFFVKSNFISPDTILDKWESFHNKSLIAPMHNFHWIQKKWYKHIIELMNSVGCQMFMTTDSDNAELRLCIFPRYFKYAKQRIFSLKHIKVKEVT